MNVLIPLANGVEEMEAVINPVTSQAPGTAFEFALTLIALAEGPDRAGPIADAMVLPRRPGHLPAKKRLSYGA